MDYNVAKNGKGSAYVWEVDPTLRDEYFTYL